MRLSLHRAVPWWAKIAAKMMLARLPVSMRTWHRIGLFAPGFMRDPAYAIDVFDAHWRRAGSPAPGFTYLELGPGESLATAIVAWAYGASGGALVDAGDFAVRDIAAYRPLIERLKKIGTVRDVGPLTAVSSLDRLLDQVNARVRTDGLEGLRTLPSDSFDLIFSQAVLEHVPLGEFPATLSELYRVQKIGGIGSHRIDFKDHLQSSLNNLRFSEATWEKPWFAARSGFYTNRLRLSQMSRVFAGVGFTVKLLEQNRWSELPLSADLFAEPFRRLSDDDLKTSGAVVLLTKGSR